MERFLLQLFAIIFTFVLLYFGIMPLLGTDVGNGDRIEYPRP